MILKLNNEQVPHLIEAIKRGSLSDKMYLWDILRVLQEYEGRKENNPK